MRNSQPWHAEAVEMRARGVSIREIARIFRKGRTTVRAAVDPAYYEAQIAHNRQVKQRERDVLAGKAEPLPKRVRKKIDRAGTLPTPTSPRPFAPASHCRV